ncbi:hypothetical protein MATL_G00252830 [Megalops atlanticus]|uniref:Uncharacterized protein n=1 Tax=Megalops atlanticus TaxID=7932 RepID=A0A9D3PAW7_MEGAT|nr:hypothetical protein MATL_G00252830 [Megalops atlanticus]
MGSVTSALTKTRNAIVKVGSEPERDSERSHSAPESARGRKRSVRASVFSSQRGRQSARQSLSEVLNGQDTGGGAAPPHPSGSALAGKRSSTKAGTPSL